VRIKVCGITNYEDAVLALELGADALGFNFFPGSPRHIAPAVARSIVRRLPPLAVFAGVYANIEDPSEVIRIARIAGVQVLQLHGDEPPDYCRQLSDWPVIKVLHMGRGPLPANLKEYRVRAFLLDSGRADMLGGTGRTFDWSLCKGLSKIHPVILAGGLNPGNVAEALQIVRPYAVDVCSGVESEPGKKDALKLKAFIREVTNVSRNVLADADQLS
jgi:phosphoribosylanthranilate isomerase